MDEKFYHIQPKPQANEGKTIGPLDFKIIRISRKAFEKGEAFVDWDVVKEMGYEVIWED